MHVVFDTNVLFSALKSRQGASYELVSMLPDERFHPVLSVPLYIEYQEVLRRPPLSDNYTDEEIIKFLRYFCRISHLQKVYFLWRPFLKDSDDDMILELAVAAGCRYVVTHNLRDFSGSERFGVEAIEPGRFLNQIRRKT